MRPSPKRPRSDDFALSSNEDCGYPSRMASSRSDSAMPISVIYNGDTCIRILPIETRKHPGLLFAPCRYAVVHEICEGRAQSV